jgi:lysophospholipase L1-like esterase
MFMLELSSVRVWGRLFLVLLFLVLGIVGCARQQIVPRGSIIFIGDSLTSGHGLREGSELYPDILGRLWGRQVFNVSKSGQRLQGADDWLEDALNSNPDAAQSVAAFVALGANDQLAGGDPAVAGENLRKVVGALRSRGMRVFIIPCIVPLRSRGYWDMYRDGARHAGEPLSHDIIGCYRAESGGISSDGIHPTESGHLSIAMLLHKCHGAILR